MEVDADLQLVGWVDTTFVTGPGQIRVKVAGGIK
jgi:hypothetical protein